MLSSVLRSDRAVDVNVAIMRAFVHVRSWRPAMPTCCGVWTSWSDGSGRRTSSSQAVFKAIRKLVQGPSVSQTKRIGFADE